MTSTSGHTGQELINLQTYSTHKGLVSLQSGSLNHILHVSFDVTPPYSTESSTSTWIVVSHHPNDVTVTSSNPPPDTDLGDQFIQPSAELVLQLISHFDHKPA